MSKGTKGFETFPLINLWMIERNDRFESGTNFLTTGSESNEEIDILNGGTHRIVPKIGVGQNRPKEQKRKTKGFVKVKLFRARY